ncbi:MAG: RagB/SusD family nutrient uptake outer membrane protein [Methylococcaceae bacterium]|nr:RagB/SusD family nutrient uptake outer membrane protein [Prolixibacteraceae bacterium]
MKIIYRSLTILLLTLCMMSCKELNPVDYSEINPSIFPKTEADIKALVLSCYYPLRGSWWDGINSDSERGQMFVNDCNTEILAGKFGVQKLAHELSFNETNDEITYFYYTRNEPFGFFSKISRCTLVMDAIESSDLSQEVKDKYIAEVRCARGYLSYILFDMYGPLVIAPLEVLKNPLKEVPLPRLSNEEMVKFIEDDLTFAGENLPYPKDAEYGKFSRGLAKTLLIRLYLHETVNDKTYYNKVETIARELMSSQYGYSLMENYPSLFQLSSMNKTNPEYIFVVPSSPAGPNMSQWFMMAMPPDSDSPVKGWGTVQSTWWFYDSFEPTDTRKTYLITEYVSSSDNKKVNRQNPGATMDLGPIAQKYMMDPSVPGNGGYSNNDIVLYRYPEVLLSLAEAIVMKPGGAVNAEALDLMNQVRRRAKVSEKTLADFPTKEAFIDQLLTERSHEFWCESGQYRADLIRFDKLYDRVLMLNNGVAPYASKYKYLYPLPLSVIVDGKGEVKQNPGYAQ